MAVECVSAFCVDMLLQTQLFKAGVLWHLLLFLFRYDFTLEEGEVERSADSNQQVSALGVNLQSFGPGTGDVFFDILDCRRPTC